MIESYRVGVRKAIEKDWKLLTKRVAFSVNNGQRVKFWKDKWYVDVALCSSFSSLYAIVDSR